MLNDSVIHAKCHPSVLCPSFLENFACTMCDDEKLYARVGVGTRKRDERMGTRGPENEDDGQDIELDVI